LFADIEHTIQVEQQAFELFEFIHDSLLMKGMRFGMMN